MRVWGQFGEPLVGEDGDVATHGIVDRQESGSINTTISRLLIPAVSKPGGWALTSISNYDVTVAKPFESAPKDDTKLLKADKNQTEAITDARAEFRSQFIRERRAELDEQARQISMVPAG